MKNKGHTLGEHRNWLSFGVQLAKLLLADLTPNRFVVTIWLLQLLQQTVVPVPPYGRDLRHVFDLAENLLHSVSGLFRDHRYFLS